MRINLSRCSQASVFGAAALGLATASSLSAATLSCPEADAYNVHVGTQTFAGLYQFTTNTLLVETAEAIRTMGSDVIKGYLGPDFPRQYRTTLPAGVTNLLVLARNEPSCRRVLDMPFRHFLFWAYPFGNSWPFDGYSAAERADDYRELYDLTCYLLTNYNHSGKTFYLGHWEGDWYLLPNYNTATNPSPVAIHGMIDWLNNRQQAVDDAKRATPHAEVDVLHYTEVNRVRDAMSGDPEINQRVINRVVPYVTNLDCVSWSSYDGMNLDSSNLLATLDYIQSNLPASKASVIPGRRVWVGEYGWGTASTPAQEPLNRVYLQKLLPWGPRFILFWEIYNNEKNPDGSLRNFCLVDQNTNFTASYYLHQRFINNARLAVARFFEANGRVPNDAEFAGLTAPALHFPLPPLVRLSVRNAGATPPTNGIVQVRGMLTQGIYGDDEAAVWVFWGREDGGTVRTSWEHAQPLGVNTNFNPATFTAMLTNLPAGSSYFFRFYATNASGGAWASASAQLIDPRAYGTRMQIRFAGYTREEPLVGFPALVWLGTSLPGFSYRQFASPTGGDLRFADALGGQALMHEIDTWNTNGISGVWAQVPWLAETNDFIWAYWGNPLAATPPAWTTNGAVWSPAHTLVWHFREKSPPFLDSADGFPSVAGQVSAYANGLIGQACSMNGSSQFLSTGNIGLGPAFSVSAWVFVNSSAASIQPVWANKSGGWNSDGFALYVNAWNTSDEKLVLETGDGTNGATAATGPGAVGPGHWHQVAAVVDETSGFADLYVDGLQQNATSTVQTNFRNKATLDLGRFADGGFYFKGLLDEARLESSLRSSNWVWAAWQTIASNSVFEVYSDSQQQVPPLTISTSGQVLLCWPASGVGFSIYSATNLMPSATWRPIAEPRALANGQWQVAVTPDNSVARFYRLQSP